MTFNRKQFETMIQDSNLLKDLDYVCIIADDDHEQPDELREKFETMIQEYEVIYYHKAMEYLSENDASLRESLELASEYGFSLEKLSSETLATLHIQNAMNEELAEIDFDEFFSEGK